jgi:hypothetical protein
MHSAHEERLGQQPEGVCVLPSGAVRDYMWSDPVKTMRFVTKHPFVGGIQVTRKLKVRFSED